MNTRFTIISRLEVSAAFLLGVLLPALETARRGLGYWSVNFTTMFEDHVAGAALLAAAVGTLRQAAWAPAWMVITWSGITFMMLVSTVSQIEKQIRGDLEAHSGIVLFIKLLLLAASAFALWQALRRLPGSDPERTSRDPCP